MECKSITDSAGLSNDSNVSGPEGPHGPSNPGREFTLTVDGRTKEYVRFNIPGHHDWLNVGTIGIVEIQRTGGDTEFLLAQAMNDDPDVPFDDDDEDIPTLYDTDEEIDMLIERGELRDIDDPDTDEEDEDDIDFGFELLSIKDVTLDEDDFDEDAVIRQ
jgi:hypothetical protein